LDSSLDMRDLDFRVFKPSEEIKNLLILEELEKNPFVSQRKLSQKTNMALGLTNAYLGKMVRKGWIRTQGLNRRRVGYYVTPKGSAQKEDLTRSLIACTVQQYAEMKSIIEGKLLEMQRNGKKRIVFYGVSDEMEVAFNTLQRVNLKLVGIVEDDEKFRSKIIFGYELEPVSRIRELKPDCIMVTSLQEGRAKMERLQTLIDGRKVSLCDIGVR